MNSKCRLSNVAIRYLEEFNCILKRMIEGMTGADLNDSISHNFIVQMVPHHRAAIEMSENLLKYTTNISLQNIALNIIKEQTESIESMRSAEDRCSTVCNSKEDLRSYQERLNRITNMMFSSMENALKTNNINANFISEMIPHHRGALKMSDNVLRFEICQELKPIINKIIVSQSKGIKQMQNIMRCIR